MEEVAAEEEDEEEEEEGKVTGKKSMCSSCIE